MRTLKTLVIAALVLGMAGIAVAELQNVEVGGKLQIRGNFYNWDDAGDTSYVNQRTQLNVKADFTNEVSTFIELDAYDVWGNDFRSNYLTGIDGRGGADVNMYQAYINVKDMWGTPLSLRVGRQELVFGSEFMLGNNNAGPYFPGLSYDAIRLTFANDIVKVDAFAGKLAETVGDFFQDDINLYGVYGSYIGIEDVTIDAYWLYIQDDSVSIGEDIDLHTIGLRGAGTLSGFDFDAEVAYQFGEVDGQPSACPFWGWPIVGGWIDDADVDYDTLAVNLDLGYTFDMSWQPRVFGQFAYLGGGDPDDNCWSNDRTLPFNRLFSDKVYTDFLDTHKNLTNAFVYGLGVQVMPTECVTLELAGKYFDLDEEVGEIDDLGWEVGISGEYKYSEDLTVSAGYSHFFGSDWDATEDCPIYDWDGDSDQDFDYVYGQMEIAF